MPLLISNPQQQCHWYSFNTTAELERAATQAILQTALHTISLRGTFHIVLAGGTTPRRIYESLRKSDADWAAWHVYFGDERCLPADHVERNSLMAAQAWLNHVAIPHTQIYPIPAEKDAQTATSAYAQTLAGIELFDLVLLGLGEDGHTASLFPGHELGNAADAPAVIVVENAPKYPPQRISLSAHRLSAARKVIFLVSGVMKQQAVRDWRNGVAIPAAAISPTNGVDVYLEAALLA
ncbi:MAG: 6-phosphogluconolactonase [Candidatus Nitrotoga sp. LAW]|nr:MAG: 6-phosphogluconolactonase [Candidatus Nitrotoga sp. LAW]